MVKSIVKKKDTLEPLRLQNLQERIVTFKQFKEDRDMINCYLQNLTKIVGSDKNDFYLISFENEELETILNILHDTIAQFQKLLPNNQDLIECIDNVEKVFEDYTSEGVFNQNKNYNLYYKSKELQYK